MINTPELRKQFKHERLLTRNEPLPVKDELQEEPRHVFSSFVLAGCIGLALIGGCIAIRPAHAENAGNPGKTHTNEEIVNAIYLAEGGSHARYAYGIRSIPYSSVEQARKLCLNTVKNNRKRFANYGYKNYPDFISFLGSRYCPTNGRMLSKREREVNRFWVNNVMYFLARGE